MGIKIENNKVMIPYEETIRNRKLGEWGIRVTGSRDSSTYDQRLLRVTDQETKMVSIKEQAKSTKVYETLNVAILDRVSVDIDIKERAGQTEDGKDFSYFYIEVDEQPYRVPVTVLQQLKGLLEEKPETKFFKVKKSGEGMKTQYQVFGL